MEQALLQIPADAGRDYLSLAWLVADRTVRVM